MKSFSQRKGLTPINNVIQVGVMSDDLRNSLWNGLHLVIWGSDGFIKSRRGPYEGEIQDFAKVMWLNFFKKPIDTIPYGDEDVLSYIRDYFFKAEWFEVYNFIEFMVDASDYYKENLVLVLNGLFEREMAGYRLIAGQITDIIDEQEVKMLTDVLSDDRFAVVNAHLQRSLELLSNRERPDFRNSIKESVSAVESMAKLMSGNSKATLGDALTALEKKGALHKALKDGFSKLYGYTSDADGIRHAMMDESNLTQADAKYFLVSCTSFINYLKTSAV